MPQDNKEFALSNFTPYEMGKNEEYMSDAQLEHFARILRNWKQELMEEVDRTKEHMQTELNNYADPNDRASQEEEFNLELRTRDRERKLIKKIEKTLDLIDKGDYGYCTACGVEIGIRRLEARPTADLCIDCKTLAEIKEKQLGDLARSGAGFWPAPSPSGLLTKSATSPYVGRFAPSPTGPLHFGSLLAALASYLDARAVQGRWLVRIEDLDPPREDPTAAAQILHILDAYGLHWDGEVRYQSLRNEAYQQFLDGLIPAGLAFPCQCSR